LPVPAITLSRQPDATLPGAVLTPRVPNGKAAIELRAGTGHLGWTGALLLIFARTAFCLVAQALTSTVPTGAWTSSARFIPSRGEERPGRTSLSYRAM